MNILRREIKAGLKPFIFWALGLFLLVFAGMTKFTAFNTADGANMAALIEKFPRVVQAVMGMVGLDLTTLGGYYSILAYFALICTAIYGVHLGNSAVSRESVDKTYEFLFTKPRSRTYILLMKLLAGWIFLTLFSVLDYLFSSAAQSVLGIASDLDRQLLLFALSVWLSGSFFFSLAAFIAAVVKNAERGALFGNLFFLYAFIMGIVNDTMADQAVLRFISPLRYFSSADILSGRLDPVFILLAVLLSGVFLAGALRSFAGKDLSAV